MDGSAPLPAWVREVLGKQKPYKSTHKGHSFKCRYCLNTRCHVAKGMPLRYEQACATCGTWFMVERHPETQTVSCTPIFDREALRS